MRIRHNNGLQAFLLTVQLPNFNCGTRFRICGIHPGEGYNLSQNWRFHGRGYFTHLRLTQTHAVTCRGDDATFDIETDEATKKLAIDHGVQSIPALKVFKGGEVVSEAMGMQPKQALADLIDNALA